MICGGERSTRGEGQPSLWNIKKAQGFGSLLVVVNLWACRVWSSGEPSLRGNDNGTSGPPGPALAVGRTS
jgi:hypothetical protein